MSLFSSLWNRVKEALQKMIGLQSVEKALHVVPAMSNEMIHAIELWGELYQDKAPWLHEPTEHDPTRVASLSLPAMIASEKARTATIEMKSEITVPMVEETVPNPDYKAPVMGAEGNITVSAVPETITERKPVSAVERAEYMNEQYQRNLLSKIRTQLEYGIAKGGLVIKPYPVFPKVENENESKTAQFAFDFIQADGFYPLTFNSSGDIIECAFVQRKVDKDTVYTRLEHHKLDGNTITVRNSAYRTKNTSTTENGALNADLGTEIKLSEVPEWSELEPQIKINNVDRLLFGYFKMPEANTIDPYSPLGVSGYSRAVDLIRDADNQYSRLLWEYEAGEMAIDADIDAVETQRLKDGTHTSMLQKQRRLFRKLELDEGPSYNPYNPSLRDSNYVQGLNTILMRIEDVCSISRGTLSDPAAEARTATELKILKQRTYAANADVQQALEKALRDVVYCMNVYCTLYNIVNDVSELPDGNFDYSNMGQYEVSFEWDDSIISDVTEELGKRLQLMEAGIESKVAVRMWYFGETEAQAREALEKIKEEARENMEQQLQYQPFGGGGR